MRMCGSWEKFMVDHCRSRRLLKQVKQSVMAIELSHDLHVSCVNVLMHTDMFSGMYSSLGSGDKLVRMCGSWEKFVVDERKSKRLLKQVKQSVMPIELSHDLHVSCVNVLMHTDMFSGMYSSLGSGDKLVRMCGRCVKFMVDQGRSIVLLKQVKLSVMPIDLSHDLHAVLNVLMHIDMFSGMKTSLRLGDILVRMCGGLRNSW